MDGSSERLLAEGYEPALSPDRNHVVYVKNANLYLMYLGTEEETLLLDTATINVNMGAHLPRWHPNGRTIFFDFVYTSLVIDLYAVESDGTNSRLLMENGSLALGTKPRDCF